MSLYRAQQKERQIREAILDLLAYFAVWNLRLDFDSTLSYLQVKASHLAVKKQLKNLIKRGKVKQAGEYYGLAKVNYKNQEFQRTHQQLLLKKARNWAKLLGLIPSVKSVVVVNSTAYGNVHTESDIDLFIITIPNRVFFAKGLLMYGLKLFKQLEDQKTSAGRFSLGMFLTTRGAKFEKDIMKVNEPHLAYWLITGIPVYGAQTWFSILKNDAFLQTKLPNYIWPKTDIRLFHSGLRWLDSLDDIGYRRHLRHTAGQAKTHHPDAFIRVRPDIINLHHKGTSAQIAEQYYKIRSLI